MRSAGSTSAAPADPPITLSIPARSDEIATVRSFAYAVGRHEGLDDEAIEDLKLALSEVAADGIEGGATAIVVTVLGRRAAIEVSVEVAGGGSDRADPTIDRTQVVRALFPSVRVDRRGDAVITTFSVREG